MIPEEIKYNLHYDDVRGDFVRPIMKTRLFKYIENFTYKNRNCSDKKL